jgi:hypothetical protein
MSGHCSLQSLPCFAIPLTIGFSFLLEIFDVNNPVYLIALEPNLAMMLISYSLVWLIAIRYGKFSQASSIFFSGGALLLNLLMLYLYFSSGESFKELASDWNEGGCGLFPNAFVFLCFCASVTPLLCCPSTFQRSKMGAELSGK